MKDLLYAFLFAALLLGLSACGDDDDGNGQDPQPQPQYEGEAILYGGEGNSRRWNLVTDNIYYDSNFAPGAYLEFSDSPDTLNLGTDDGGPDVRIAEGYIFNADRTYEGWSLEENGIFFNDQNGARDTFNLLLRLIDEDGATQGKDLVRHFNMKKLTNDTILIQNVLDPDENIRGYALVPAN